MSSIVALFCCFRNDNLKSVAQQVDLRSVSTAGIYKTTIYKRPEPNAACILSVAQQVNLRSVSTAGIYKTTIYKRPEHLVYNLVAEPIDTKAEKIEKIKLQIDALLEELSKLEE